MMFRPLCHCFAFALGIPGWAVAQITAPVPGVTPPADAAPAPAAATATGRPLRQLLIADTIEELQKMAPQPGAGFVVLSTTLAAFDRAELTKRLAAGENQVIEERLLAAAAQVIENFVRQADYPAATAIIPTQSIAEGVVRVLVQLGAKSAGVTVTPTTEWRIRNIKIPETRWFSESLLREKLRIEQGGMIRFAELDRAISWTNNNPFRQVRVHLEPVPNTGEADITIAVQEAMPLRLTLSADNSGNDLIGKHRYVASLSYANLWGLDHQVSYQYITGDELKIVQGHGLDYRVPLPWQHYVQLERGSVTSAS